jgi:hypothetical protein
MLFGTLGWKIIASIFYDRFRALEKKSEQLNAYEPRSMSDEALSKASSRLVARIEDWETVGADRFAYEVSQLPEPFRKRIEYFAVRGGMEWLLLFGDYELFTLQEAAKIAEYPIEVIEEITRREQDEEMLPAEVAELFGLYLPRHTVGTWEASRHLAAMIIADPDSLCRAHGALCDIVGCKKYGCFATSKEAEDERSAIIGGNKLFQIADSHLIVAASSKEAMELYQSLPESKVGSDARECDLFKEGAIKDFGDGQGPVAHDFFDFVLKAVLAGFKAPFVLAVSVAGDLQTPPGE